MSHQLQVSEKAPVWKLECGEQGTNITITPESKELLQPVQRCAETENIHPAGFFLLFYSYYFIVFQNDILILAFAFFIC